MNGTASSDAPLFMVHEGHGGIEFAGMAGDRPSTGIQPWFQKGIAHPQRFLAQLRSTANRAPWTWRYPLQRLDPKLFVLRAGTEILAAWEGDEPVWPGIAPIVATDPNGVPVAAGASVLEIKGFPGTADMAGTASAVAAAGMPNFAQYTGWSHNQTAAALHKDLFLHLQRRLGLAQPAATLAKIESRQIPIAERRAMVLCYMRAASMVLYDIASPSAVPLILARAAVNDATEGTLTIS